MPNPLDPLGVFDGLWDYLVPEQQEWLAGKVIKGKPLKVRTVLGIRGLAAYDHRTGEVQMLPWWKPTPFYLVSMAHEVGHMLHHQEIGTEAYEAAARFDFWGVEREAWMRGREFAQAWGIEQEYRDVMRRELWPERVGVS